MNITPTDFLTERELSRGPDLLRPGTATGHLGNGRIAFIYAQYGDEPAYRLFSVPAAVGHEQFICRRDVLEAMFGDELAKIEAETSYERAIFDEQGKETRKIVELDHIEIRKLAMEKNLLGRFGTVRGREILMLWNQPLGWERMVEKVVGLLGVSADAILTAGKRELGQMRF